MKQRDNRFDLLKLAAMLGIVFIHCVANCGLLEEIRYLSGSYFLISAAYTVGFAMTNVFVIVSSHLLIAKYRQKADSVRPRKVVGMLVLTSVYSTALYLLLIVCGAADFSLFALLKSVFSVFVNQYWFVGAYLFLYMVSPLLFRALDIFGERELRFLCLTSLLFFSVFPTVFIFESTLEFYDAQHGKSIIWMLLLFTLTFYLDKFGTARIKRITKAQLLLLTAGSASVLVVSRLVLRYVSYLLHMGGDGEGRMFFDESLFIVLISFGIYLLTLKSAPLPENRFFSRAVPLASGTTLGIYLIHNNPHLREVLWEAGRSFILSRPGMELLFLTITVLAVFLGCFLLELGRILLARKLFPSKGQ